MGIDQSKPVLVTGGNGYVASWLVKYLLEDGIDVHATVRDPENADKVGHLRTIAERAEGELTLFPADLLDADAFDAPMQGCELVCHTASPFVIKNDLGMTFRPAEETVVAHFQQMLDDGVIRKR